MNIRTFALPKPFAAIRSYGLSALVLLCACSGDGQNATGPPSPSETPPAGSSSIIDTETKLYSQFDEELVIRDFFNDERNGFFVDVGCAYPIRMSTTYYLEKHLGWTGIAIDALDSYRQAWTEQRPNSTFLSYAVTDKSGETITFHVAAEPGLSSISEERAEEWGGPESVPIEVPTITLNNVLEDHGVKRIDFLSIDIEGAEVAALAGFDIERFKPRLVCIEAHTADGANETPIRDYFEEHGHELLARYLPHDTINWYFAPKNR